MITKRFSRTALLLSCAAVVSFSSAAKAGFEWKGPLEPPAPAAEAPATAPESSGGNMSDLAPVTSGAAPAAPAPAAQAPAAQTMSAPPAQTMSAPPAMTQMSGDAAPQPAPAAAPAASGDVLAGFASDIPLVMALQQIVPPGYQYAFAAGVDPGASVSWEGGKPWQGVLSDMLAKQNLGYMLQNNTVVISPAAAGAQPPAQSAAAQPMPAPAAPAAMSSADASQQNSGSGPISIVSQPPVHSDQSAPTSPAANGQAANGQAANGMTAMPADAAPAQAAPTQMAGAQQSADHSKEVDIRRKRTPSLFERMGFKHWHGDSDGETSSPGPGPKTAVANPNMNGSSANATGNLLPPGGAGAMQQNGSAAMPASGGAPPQRMAAADTPPPPVMNDMSSQGNMSAPPPAQSSSAGMPVGGEWQGAKGQTLRDVLKAWSDKAGVDLYWSIDYDYRLTDDTAFGGSYDEAVGHLLDRFSSVRPQPYGQLHQSTSGPRVLVIKSYDLPQ
jgi:hypothetical protein